MSYLPVTLTSPAQGDVLYYDGNKFVNLAHGTVGQLLQTNGASANPSWASLPAEDLSPAVILSPGSVGRNLVKPTADGDSLTLRPFADAQTNPILQVQNAAGSASSVSIKGNGEVQLGGVGQNTTRQRVISPGSAVDASFIMEDESGNRIVSFSHPNNDMIVTINAVTDDANLFLASRDPGATSPLIWARAFGAGAFRSDFQHLPDGSTHWSVATNVENLAGVFDLIPGFLSNIDASWTGRTIFQAGDHNGKREALRIEADGTAARIGFLGAAAAVRQTGGAATATLIYTATEQGMLQKAYDALRTFGLLT